MFTNVITATWSDRSARLLWDGQSSSDIAPIPGAVQIQVPRDTDSSFNPQIVKKRQRRLTGVDEIILSLSAKGLTAGEIFAHFDDAY